MDKCRACEYAVGGFAEPVNLVRHEYSSRLTRRELETRRIDPMMEFVDVTKIYVQGAAPCRPCAACRMAVDAGRVRLDHGAERLRQIDLLHLLGALDTPTAGEVFFQGASLHTLSDRRARCLRRERIGFVFQFFNLLPTLTRRRERRVAAAARRSRRCEALKPAMAGSSASACWIGPNIIPKRCPAARCSAWPSPGPWSPSPKRCCATSRPATSTRPRSKEILKLLRSLPEPGKRSVVMVTHDPQGGRGTAIASCTSATG